MTAADRISEILDTESAISPATTRARRTPRGHLRFEHVGFRFSPDSAEVLHDINLDLAPGTTLALVGATGSGKTTLTALVPRLYDVTGGRITIDGARHPGPDPAVAAAARSPPRSTTRRCSR